MAGWVNVDCVESVTHDVLHNLEDMPWPFADNSAEEITMHNVLEHLSDTVATMVEIHRILEPGGRCHIDVPYAASLWSFQDPTHKSYFTERTFDYFKDADSYNFYSGARFVVLEARLTCGANCNDGAAAQSDSVSIRPEMVSVEHV